MSFDFSCSIQVVESESTLPRVNKPGCWGMHGSRRRVIVWGICSWHTVELLSPTENHLNIAAYPTIVADHAHPFLTTVCHVTKVKSSQTCFLNMKMSSVLSQQICRYCVMLSCQCGQKSLRNIYSNLLNLWNSDLRQLWRQIGFNPTLTRSKVAGEYKCIYECLVISAVQTCVSSAWCICASCWSIVKQLTRDK